MEGIGQSDRASRPAPGSRAIAPGLHFELIPVFVAAVVFALLYRWRRDTPCNIIAHFITDGLGFLTT